MSRASHSIRRGLEQAVTYAQGQAKKGYRVHVPAHVDVKAIRMKLGLTQQGVCRAIRLQHQYAASLGARKAGTRRANARVPSGDRPRTSRGSKSSSHRLTG